MLVYVVAQQDAHGASVSSDRSYTDRSEAEKEVAWWHKAGCPWMKLFILCTVDKVPEYMTRDPVK